MIVEAVKPKSLTQKQVRSLSQMNNHEYGLLLTWLQESRKTDIGTIFVATEGEEIIGWSMLVPDGHTGYWTKSRYRRRGVATALVDAMYQYHGKKLLVDWPVASQFFDRNKDKVMVGNKFYLSTQLLRGKS